MTLFVSVKREVIFNNAQYGRNDPPFEVRISHDDRAPRRYHSFSIPGNNVRMIYDPEHPLGGGPDGPICWLEVDEI